MKNAGTACAFERMPGSFFVIEMSPIPDLPETLATTYNPGLYLLALPVIAGNFLHKIKNYRKKYTEKRKYKIARL